MNKHLRHSYKDGFKPAKPAETVDMPIALDNLVCGVCGETLGDVGWIVVSSPKKKGIIIFACKEHVGAAMNQLGKMVLGLSTVPTDLKLPITDEN